jgi:hypothetical protein
MSGSVYQVEVEVEVLTLHEHVSRHHLLFSQILAQSDLKYGHQVAILKKQLSAVTPELMAGSTPNFNHRYIYLLGILYGFFTRGDHYGPGPGHFIQEWNDHFVQGVEAKSNNGEMGNWQIGKMVKREIAKWEDTARTWLKQSQYEITHVNRLSMCIREVDYFIFPHLGVTLGTSDINYYSVSTAGTVGGKYPLLSIDGADGN